jgi:hypothetical protein
VYREHKRVRERRREGRREGGKEGRREGGKEGRREGGRKEREWRLMTTNGGAQGAKQVASW